MLIDSVTVFKLILKKDNNLIFDQVTIALPERQVNSKVICIPTHNKDTIECYCFY